MSTHRTICIGDVHGCLTLLEKLLHTLNYDPASDRLVFVGDLIDRGPHPAGVVRLVRKLASEAHVTVMRGNHEDKMLQWFDRVERARTTGKPNHSRPPHPDRLRQWEELSLEDRAWLGSLPLYERVAPGWIAVHAGFEDIPMAEQKADRVMRVRWLNRETGKHIGIDPDSETGLVLPAHAVYWMERWRGPENVVYGHAVHSRKTPRVDRPVPGVETWGIDTGACYGGCLTALCLETKDVTQVSDGQAYARLYGKLTDELV